MALKWWCEIDPHCRKLLADKYRESDSHDDILTFETRAERRVDVLAGGTPCQGFSVAGLRGSLADDRSNLCLRFCTIADELDPTVIVWEQVPGVLSAADNAFGCFLARLAGADAPLVPTGECGGRWTNAGVVDGPRRAVAWRIIDAQYTGVAQRRARVFVVASARRELPFQILFEPEGVRRHSPPSRGAREGVARPITAGSAGGSGYRNDADTADNLIPSSVGALSNGAHDGGGQTDRTPTPDESSLPEIAWALQERDAKGADSSTKDGHLIPTRRGGFFDDVADPLCSREGKTYTQEGSGNFRTRNVIPAASPMWEHGRFFCRRCKTNFGVNDYDSNTVTCPKCGNTACDGIVDSLQDEDGAIPIQEVGKRTGKSTTDKRAGIGIGIGGDPMFSLQAGAQHGIASPDNRCQPQSGKPCHPLAAGAHPPAVAFQTRIARNGRGQPDEICPALNGSNAGETSDMRPCVATFQQSSQSGKGTIGYDESGIAKPTKTQQDGQMIHSGMAVRRLTPVECCRLMGWPDDWLDGYGFSDSTKYRMCGNGIVSTVSEWLGRRIVKALET